MVALVFSLSGIQKQEAMKNKLLIAMLAAGMMTTSVTFAQTTKSATTTQDGHGQGVQGAEEAGKGR